MFCRRAAVQSRVSFTALFNAWDNCAVSCTVLPSYRTSNGQRIFSTAPIAREDGDEDYGLEGELRQTRLQQLRERLRSEPSNNFKPSVPSNTTADNQTKTLHWKEVLDQLLSTNEAVDQVLTDRFGRHHNYLRVSLTERCNLRCTYCMPLEGVPLQPASHLLQTPEILALASHFQQQGVNKIRLTGGEPTLRKDLTQLLHGLKALGGFDEIAMTTNAVTLAKHLDEYLEAGLNRVNISLDTLQPSRFESLARRPPGYWHRVWDAIELASKVPREELVTKVNFVVMKGVNEDEVADFCSLLHEFPNIDVRFIEYMPFTDNGWNMEKWIPYRDLLSQLEEKNNLTLEKLPETDPNDTTKWYTLPNHKGKGRIGFITSMSKPFCGTCNRMRLTADGLIKVCLFDGNSTISLRDALREGAGQDDLNRLIQFALHQKHFSLGGHDSPEHILRDSDSNRPMTLIGG